ncbi:MAG: hypothetical protein ACI4N3_02975 [Alphaproteobacteria bacterium]
MAEITTIQLTDEAFNNIEKNIKKGTFFVSFPTGISNDVNAIENNNPTKEELQERINSLYKRFQTFQTEQEKAGIKEIKFKTILDKQISALLNKDITNDKDILEAVKQAENTMLKLEKDVAFIKATENPIEPPQEEVQTYLKEVITKLNPELKKQLQQTIEGMIQKQIEKSK